MGEFKENQKVLDKCKSFKIEYAPETVIARSYGKFESTLLDVCLLCTSPSPRDLSTSRMPSSA